MEQVIDNIILELDTLKSTEEFSAILEVYSDVKLDDPGFVLIDEYPYIFVSPIRDNPISETVGKTGYDVRRLEITIGIVINAADYFDPTISEAHGVRQLIQASNLIRSHLRRLAKRSLNGLSGVRSLVVASTNYTPGFRGDTFVRIATTNITVERQYQHED